MAPHIPTERSAMARYLEDFKPGYRYETASVEMTEEMIFQFAG
jgi:hypothetical protein